MNSLRGYRSQQEIMIDVWSIVGTYLTKVFTNYLELRDSRATETSDVRRAALRLFQNTPKFDGTVLGTVDQPGLVDAWIGSLLHRFEVALAEQPPPQVVKDTLRIYESWIPIVKIAKYILSENFGDRYNLELTFYVGLNRSSFIVRAFSSISNYIKSLFDDSRNEKVVDEDSLRAARPLFTAYCRANSNSDVHYHKKFVSEVYKSGCDDYFHVEVPRRVQDTQQCQTVFSWLVQKATEEQRLFANYVSTAFVQSEDMRTQTFTYIKPHFASILRGTSQCGTKQMLRGRDAETLSHALQISTAVSDLTLLEEISECYADDLSKIFVGKDEMFNTEQGRQLTIQVLLEAFIDIYQFISRCAFERAWLTCAPYVSHAFRTSFVHCASARINFSVERELAVKFHHVLQKKSCKDDDEWESFLMSSTFIAGSLTESDIFLESYRSHLERRMLGRDPDIERESALLKRLRDVLPHLTQHPENVLLDARQASHSVKTESVKEEARASNHGCIIEATFRVLNMAYWTSIRSFALTFPDSIAKLIASFEMEYIAEKQERSLTWDMRKVQGSIVVSFNMGDREIQGDGLQLSLILQLARGRVPRSSFEQQRIPDALVKLLLKLKLIAEKDGCLVINRQFTDKRRRIELPTAGHEKTEVDHGLATLRETQVDTAIMKALKSKQTMSLMDLHKYVSEALSGRLTLTLPFFKARLDSLMAKEFIRRDESNHSILHFT